MTDDEMTDALATLVALETRARATWTAARDRDDLPEADNAIIVARLVRPTIRALEQWMAVRATRPPRVPIAQQE